MRTQFLTTILMLFFATTAQAATVQLPRTGQTVCYDAAGGVTACATTGQDGDKLKGVVWPVPRFTDNANGSVTDNLSGLIWLKEANCWGAITWQTGLTNANALVGNNTQCSLNDGSVAGDWRMPNIVELESLIDLSRNSPAIPAGHPFSNVQSSWYWSSSSIAAGTGRAWGVRMGYGHVLDVGKGDVNVVWPVRGGQ